jgi:hypothetical protein
LKVTRQIVAPISFTLREALVISPLIALCEWGLHLLRRSLQRRSTFLRGRRESGRKNYDRQDSSQHPWRKSSKLLDYSGHLTSLRIHHVSEL